MQQLNLFEVLQDLTPAFQLAELFEAYQSCRRTKRNTLKPSPLSWIMNPT